jgi:hypothetical protein
VHPHSAAKSGLSGGEAVAGLGVGILAEGEDLGWSHTEDQTQAATEPVNLNEALVGGVY